MRRRKIASRRNPARSEYSPDDRAFWAFDQDFTLAQINDSDDSDFSWEMMFNQDQLNAKLVELPSGITTGLDVDIIIRLPIQASQITVGNYLYYYEKYTGDNAKSSWLFEALSGQIKNRSLWN